MPRLIFLFLLTALLFTCTNEPCDDVSCANDGVCENGTCRCLDFYEGDNCQREARSKFIGNWNTSNSNCNDLNDVPVLPNVIVEAQASDIDDLRFQIPELLGPTWVDASLSGNNSATFSTSFDTVAISGSLNFTEDLAFSLTFTTDVSCVFNLNR